MNWSETCTKEDPHFSQGTALERKSISLNEANSQDSFLGDSIEVLRLCEEALLAGCLRGKEASGVERRYAVTIFRHFEFEY